MALELKPHQKKAVERMRSGTVLVGGTGSGKSVTAIAWYWQKLAKMKLPTEEVPKQKPTDIIPLYIITTAKKRDNLEWLKELAYFGLTSDDVVIDSWNNISKYRHVQNAFFIFDEQRLVGTGTWAMSFRHIASKNYWVVLTATPGDTWMDYLSIFIANGFYRNKKEFELKHVVYVPHIKFPKVQRYLDEELLEKIKKEICVYMEYLKDTIQHHEWVVCDYDKEAYLKVFKERWNVYEDKPLKNISATCYVGRRVINSDYSRQHQLALISETHSKLLVFYNFDYELDILRVLANTLGIPYSEWNGHKHQNILQTDSWWYLVQYTAGAEGWECIETNAMVFFSQTYSYKATIQAAGRIDRMTTPFKDLYYYHLYSNAPIDKTIKLCYKKKKNFNERNFLAK